MIKYLLWSSKLSITHICDGEEVVTGGEDGQTYIATFGSHEMAELFVSWCNSHSGPNRISGFVSDPRDKPTPPQRDSKL